MIIIEINIQEYNLILSSLEHTRRAFERYENYPSYDFKLQRIAEVENLRQKITEARKEMKNENPTEQYQAIS